MILISHDPVKESAELFGRKKRTPVTPYLSKGAPYYFKSCSHLCSLAVIHQLCHRILYFAIKTPF